MTILDCCISLKVIKKNLVVLGVVDMRQLLLNLFYFINLFEFPKAIEEEDPSLHEDRSSSRGRTRTTTRSRSRSLSTVH